MCKQAAAFLKLYCTIYQKSSNAIGGVSEIVSKMYACLCRKTTAIHELKMFPS